MTAADLGRWADDLRLQVYRTAVDSLLSWMATVAQAIERDLFWPEDLAEARYWVQAVADRRFLDGFIHAYGYDRPLALLRKRYAVASQAPRITARASPPIAPETGTVRGGFGGSARGWSGGG